MNTIKYNEEYMGGFLAFSFTMENEKVWSGYGIKKPILREILEKNITMSHKKINDILHGLEVEMEDELCKKLKLQIHDQRHEKYNGTYVPKGCDKDLVDKVENAFKHRLPVMVEYAEGFEIANGNKLSNNDGSLHIFHIGKSTGKRPSYLALLNENRESGELFSFSGIKKLHVVEF